MARAVAPVSIRASGAAGWSVDMADMIAVSSYSSAAVVSGGS